MALPRGGVPVAAEIARFLQLPLDIALVRKVGVPGQPELAVAAVTASPQMQLTVNRELADILRLDDDAIRALARRELPELERRQKAYRGNCPPRDVAGRTVILVDDGVATGATARAAMRLLREAGAKRIILALPVAPAEASAELREDADEIICLETPKPFFAVGYHYREFEQVPDDEVSRILEEAASWSPKDDGEPDSG